MSMKCARDNTCKDLLILPEMKWHPSLTLEHRMRNQERLAFCPVLLLTPTPTLCHHSVLHLSPCLSFPIYILQVCKSNLLHVFFKERSSEKKAKRGKEGMERQILPALVSPYFAQVRTTGEAEIKGTMKAGSTTFQTSPPWQLCPCVNRGDGSNQQP